MSNQGSETVATYQVKVLRSVDEVSEEDWNQCALDSAGEGKENPFILWAFFKALEDSKSAVREVGWAASHIAVK
jgi:predicted N-acyltransferase